jgi:hypothetical protein
MRQLFLIILIALLPLRGWISDAMATGMMAGQMQQQTATKNAAAHAHGTGDTAHFDTEKVAAQAHPGTSDCAGHASGAEPHAAEAHCESCSACQACHTLALSPVAADMTVVANLSPPPRVAVAQFSSAETALHQKPPIS